MNSSCLWHVASNIPGDRPSPGRQLLCQVAQDVARGEVCTEAGGQAIQFRGLLVAIRQVGGLVSSQVELRRGSPLRGGWWISLNNL